MARHLWAPRRHKTREKITGGALRGSLLAPLNGSSGTVTVLCLLGSALWGNVGSWPSLSSRCEIIFFPSTVSFCLLAFLLSVPLHTSLRPPPVPFPTPNPLFVSVSLFSLTTLPLLLFPCLATIPLHLFHPILLPLPPNHPPASPFPFCVMLYFPADWSFSIEALWKHK